MRAVLFHVGLLAGATGTVFFTYGLVSLLAGDQTLTALVDAHGPGSRGLALALLAANILFSLLILAGSLRIRTRGGPVAAGIGYLLLALTFAWAAWDKLNADRPLMDLLDVALPAGACLLLAGLCLLARPNRRG